MFMEFRVDKGDAPETVVFRVYSQRTLGTVPR
jgi:hypothetical protein